MVADYSARDLENNILALWTHPDELESVDGLPSDGAVCWLYLADFDSWMVGLPQAPP